MPSNEWALPALRKVLPLDDEELRQIVAYTDSLSDADAARHLNDLLGASSAALEFVALFLQRRGALQAEKASPHQAITGADDKGAKNSLFSSAPGVQAVNGPNHSAGGAAGSTALRSVGQPSLPAVTLASKTHDDFPPGYTASSTLPSSSSRGDGPVARHRHTNAVIQAGHARAKDEVCGTREPAMGLADLLILSQQEMQQALQNLQYEYRIYNPEIEPEHDTEYYCGCSIHQYQRLKWRRLNIQNMWSRAVMYPANNPFSFGGNPYVYRVRSPFGYGFQASWGPPRPLPRAHMNYIQDTIALSNQLNREAQVMVDAREPKQSIWTDETPKPPTATPDLDTKAKPADAKSDAKRRSVLRPVAEAKTKQTSASFSGFKKALGIKSTEEKATEKASSLRQDILLEEQGRWPDTQYRRVVADYQVKVGMAKKIASLREHCPIQYLHLLRAGYFEPIPVAWATQASNPLKFSIEAKEGWRGVTPAWRGYEDLAEERLYWVLNHREGSVGMRMKPDFISEMNMAQARMQAAVEPPPMYYSPDDTCMRQHTSSKYSKQVMPAPFRSSDRPELPTDDSMILLDVSGSMDFDPVRPIYDQYLITGYAPSTQPKNKDVAKSIIRRFTDALANHDHQTAGYDLVTFSSKSTYIGTINHRNFDHMWYNVRVGGGTRVMTGWQRVKDMHFQKHHESAVHHQVYGWQAGPETPMLRLLLFLDGEATDMDEFELDLLGLSWAHVTIFLIGVDNCPHHHRHANELQRISDVNHHVSFVDAQGNCPERYVTHELLKRHLGYDVSLQEFEHMEQLPAYSEAA
ncbi:von Willebrand factor, type A [Niveomyces insectorum RCEF 264]|uniref:von Willebrand factor, type A n=1 Tax=Niveomyces insectorum RCEF 264 TaxID=1081102 RepID=A0A167PXN1_9HYPO|nr:von Willebrand factor, type A [Niveomyces insectorum RCEF 264]